jgi:hypothetical protein
MDLNSIFGPNCNFTLSQLKQKIGLLKIFEKDDLSSFIKILKFKDLKNIDKFDSNSKGKSCEIKDYQIIFSIDN